MIILSYHLLLRICQVSKSLHQVHLHVIHIFSTLCSNIMQALNTAPPNMIHIVESSCSPSDTSTDPDSHVAFTYSQLLIRSCRHLVVTSGVNRRHRTTNASQLHVFLKTRHRSQQFAFSLLHDLNVLILLFKMCLFCSHAC